MEKWRDIPGYETLYQASTEGRIRTCEGKTTRSARFEKRIWKQRIMRQKYQKRKNGPGKDARVCLWKDGNERTHLVSRLVASAWCDGYSEGLTVNHIDGNPQNNRADNLEWVTIGENVRKAFEDGLIRTAKKCTLVTENGDEFTYRSMAEASRSIGRHTGYISGLIKKGKEYAPNGYKIVIHQD